MIPGTTEDHPLQQDRRSMMFGKQGLRLCLLNRPLRMLRRGIQRIQLQQVGRRGVDDVVSGASRHNNGITFADFMLPALEEVKARLALLNAKELIHGWMNLISDGLTGLQGHQDELNVLSGEEHMPKVAILFGELLKVANKRFHVFSFRHASDKAPT
jgi:hypothetical protein